MSVPSGLLIIDKPAGWTSHDVVARARRLCGTRRVGHAGTLDPMATGVLVLGVERATKLLTFLVGCDKSYAATIRLGQSTLTDDAEGEPTESRGVGDPAAVQARLADAVSRLTGDIEQVPSSVSAIKVKGVRSYTRVRQGDAVDLPARPVTVSRFEVLGHRPGTAATPDGATVEVLDVDVEVEVSSGTYVRALARDLGAALGVGGHLTALRRTRVGGFDLEQATSLDELIAHSGQSEPSGPAETPGPAGRAAEAGAGAAALPLVPLVDAARAQLPVHEITAAEAVRIGYGQRIRSGASGADAVAAIDPVGRLVAVLDETGAQAKARVVFETSPPASEMAPDAASDPARGRAEAAADPASEMAPDAASDPALGRAEAAADPASEMAPDPASEVLLDAADPASDTAGEPTRPAAG